jgi:hypothetical protein
MTAGAQMALDGACFWSLRQQEWQAVLGERPRELVLMAVKKMLVRVSLCAWCLSDLR